MPEYSTLFRSSSQAPSNHTQCSIRPRSGARISPLSSPKAPAISGQTAGYRLPGVPQDAEAGHSNGHATASSPSHFTAIPARSHRSSIASHHGLRRPPSHPVTPTMTKVDDSFSSIGLLDADDNTIASSRPSATPIAPISTSYSSQLSVNIQLLAKQASSLSRSGLVFLYRKIFSLPNARLPIFNSHKPLSLKSRPGPGQALTGANAKPPMSAVDKLTHKWPRPRSYRSIPPELHTNPLSPRHLREPKGAAGSNLRNIEAILQESQGLGVNWIGQWTPHKWSLLASVTTVFLLGLTFLVFSLLTWFAGESVVVSTSASSSHYPNLTAYSVAPVLLITDSPALILLTISSSLLLFASLVGITGTLLNSRPILAVYVLLLFPSFLSFISVAYVTYKKANFSLDAKVSEAWNLWYSPGARSILQGAFSCCGWSSPYHGAAASGTCYARSPLPGCHGPLVSFERDTLSSVAGAVFCLVPLHLINIVTGLLCSNHVTHRFGKGIMPPRYRLTAHDIVPVAPDGKQGTRQIELPFPPLPAPNGHITFREDRQIGTTYRHARGKFGRERDA